MAFFPPEDTQDVSGLPANDAMAQLELQRRIKMAQQLQDVKNPEGQMVSGHYVAPSWTQYAANAMNKYYGRKAEEEAIKGYGEYEQNKQSKLSEAFDKYIKGQNPIAETTTTDNYVNKPYKLSANIPTSPFGTLEQVAQTLPSFNTQNLPQQSVNEPITSTTYRQPTRTEQIANLATFAKSSNNPDLLNKMVLSQAENLFKKPDLLFDKPNPKDFTGASLLEYQKTGDPSVLVSNVKPETAGSLEKDYTFAKSQGYPGSIEDFKRISTNYINPYQQAQLDKKAAGLFDAEDLNMMADQALAGDKSVFAGLGRGTQGPENIKALRHRMNEKMIDRGWSGADIAAKNAEFTGLMAGERAVGTRGANVELAGKGFLNIVPIAQEASDKVSRSKFLPFGKAQIMFDETFNDPDVSQFAAANNGLVNTYARAISPTGIPTKSDKDHARDILSMAKDKPAYDRAVQTLVKEIEAEKAAPKQVRENLRSEINGSSGLGSSGGKVVHWNDL